MAFSIQGTLRRVAAEVEVQVNELMALLKERVMAQASDAVECIGLIRRLGGPVADLQVCRQAFLCYNEGSDGAASVAVKLLVSQRYCRRLAVKHVSVKHRVRLQPPGCAIAARARQLDGQLGAHAAAG